MYRSILWPQLKRAPWRTGLFIVILAITTAFFCLSMNLYINSVANIETAKEAFSTIAVLEFFGATQEAKQAAAQTGLSLTDDDRPLDVSDVSLEELETLPGVEQIDLRRYLAAYIPGHVAYTPAEQTGDPAWGPEADYPYDLIRFVLTADQKITFDRYSSVDGVLDQAVNVKVLWSASNSFRYEEEYQIITNLGYTAPGKYLLTEDDALQQSQLETFNQGTDNTGATVVLEPGVEYLACVQVSGGFVPEENGPLKFPTKWEKRYNGSTYITYGSFRLTFDNYGKDLLSYRVLENSVRSLYQEVAAADQPIGIWKWEEVQKDPDLQEYFEQVAQAYEYSTHSFTVTTTNDLYGIYEFYSQKAFVKEGRDFSPEDYADGNRVCIISKALAEAQGWQLGDTIDMKFYEYDGYVEQEREGGSAPAYTKRTTDFLEQGSYTIIGLWDRLDLKNTPLLDDATVHLPWDSMFVPTASVQTLGNASAPVSGSRLTIHLENGMMEDFLQAIEGKTFSQSAKLVSVNTFDQGFSDAQPGLMSMLGTAQLLLVLSAVLVMISGILAAFFYTQGQRRNISLMRMLGCTPRQSGTMGFLGSLMILLPGVFLGTGTGHFLTNKIANVMLESNTLEKPEYQAFREYFGVQVPIPFAMDAQISVSMTALVIVAALFLLGCVTFILLHLRKEPREMLSEK